MPESVRDDGALNSLEDLDKKTNMKIDEHIEILVKWCEKYPRIKVASDMSYLEIVKLAKLSVGPDEDYNDLLKEYDEMQKHYTYIRERNYAGKLTEEQIKKCKDGNVQGIFGYPTRVEELSKRLKIKPNKVEYILLKYGSLEEFCMRYLNKELDNEDKWKLGENLKECIDISCLNSKGLDLIFGEILRIKSNGKDYTGIPFYYGNKLVEQLNRLQFRETAMLANSFSLTNEPKLTQKEFGATFGVSHTRVYQLVKKSIDKLRDNGAAKKVSLPSNQVQEIREILEKNLSVYDNMFYPDKEFEREESKIFFEAGKVNEDEKIKLFNPQERKETNLEEKILSSKPITSLWNIGDGSKVLVVESLLKYIKTLDERINDAEEQLSHKKDIAYNTSRLNRFRNSRDQAKEILSSVEPER